MSPSDCVAVSIVGSNASETLIYNSDNANINANLSRTDQVNLVRFYTLVTNHEIDISALDVSVNASNARISALDVSVNAFSSTEFVLQNTDASLNNLDISGNLRINGLVFTNDMLIALHTFLLTPTPS